MNPKYNLLTKLDVITDVIKEIEDNIPSQAGGHYYTALNVLAEIEDKTRAELQSSLVKTPQQKSLFN